MNTKSSFKK